MRYSDDLIEEIRQKNDIVDVIGGYVKLQRKGSSYFGLCPFHNEKSPSFSVSPLKQMYYCFGCGAGGNVFTFIMEYENYTFLEALKMLAERAGVELPELEYSKEAKEQADKKSQLLQINKEAAKYYYDGICCFWCYDRNLCRTEPWCRENGSRQTGSPLYAVYDLGI